MGLVDWRLHDLRRTVSTVMHGDLAVPPHIVEAVLNHSGGHRAGVAGVYNRASYASKKFCACALGRLFGGRCRCDLIITDARLGTQKPGDEQGERSRCIHRMVQGSEQARLR